ncbi:flagellar hook-associated family protein, partial [Vibrio parahaemolyticus V-223/04]
RNCVRHLTGFIRRARTGIG